MKLSIAPAVAAAMLASLPAWATSVYVVSVGIRDVQVILNGQEVRTLQLGEVSQEGVRLMGIDNGAAVLEVGGRTIALRPGQSTVSQTVLRADALGHFVASARINGVPVSALIDTGATFVSLSSVDAQRMGIDYLQGKRSMSQTANGPVPVYMINLAHVQVGDIAFANIPGLVVEEGAGPQMPALIGMSFLRHVEMRRSGNTMVLLRAER